MTLATQFNNFFKESRPHCQI